MATSGQHLPKPQRNPKVNGKKIIATVELMALLATAGLGVKYGSDAYEKKQQEKIEKRELEISQFTENFKVMDLFNGIVSQYKTYQNNSDKLNTVGLVFQYFSDKISNPNLSEEQKIELLQNLLNDENLYDDIYTYIDNNIESIQSFEHKDVEDDKLYSVTNDVELMQQIHEASEAYKVPESVLIGLIALNSNGDKIAQSSILYSYHSDWNNLNSNRSSHNYITGEDDQLKGWNGKNSVMHLAAILENSIKQENKDLFLAIEGVLAGPKNMDNYTKYGNLDSRYADKANEVLSYATRYLNDERISLDYNAVSETMTYTTTFESNLYQDYLVSILNSIINTLDINIIQYYNNGVSLH